MGYSPTAQKPWCSLSWAAAQIGAKAYVVMPSNAPKAKIASVEYYGGIVTFCEPTLEARETTAEQVRKDTGALLIHPYDNYNIIAGQATATYELLQEHPDAIRFLCLSVAADSLLEQHWPIAILARPRLLVVNLLLPTMPIKVLPLEHGPLLNLPIHCGILKTSLGHRISPLLGSMSTASPCSRKTKFRRDGTLVWRPSNNLLSLLREQE